MTSPFTGGLPREVALMVQNPNSSLKNMPTALLEREIMPFASLQIKNRSEPLYADSSPQNLENDTIKFTTAENRSSSITSISTIPFSAAPAISKSLPISRSMPNSISTVTMPFSYSSTNKASNTGSRTMPLSMSTTRKPSKKPPSLSMAEPYSTGSPIG